MLANNYGTFVDPSDVIMICASFSALASELLHGVCVVATTSLAQTRAYR